MKNKDSYVRCGSIKDRGHRVYSDEHRLIFIKRNLIWSL